MQRFWMVMRVPKDGGSEQPIHLRPAVKHFKSAEAFDEAKRLAAQHPGETFAIMVAFTTVRLPFEIKTTTHAIEAPSGGMDAIAPATKEGQLGGTIAAPSASAIF